MRIGELIYEMLLDEAVSKGILNRLKAKWGKENPEVTDDILELIASQFYGGVKGSKQIQRKIKDAGGKDHPLIKSFLLRHGGDDGTKPFNPNSLLDLTAYSWNQIVDLFDEFDINVGNLITKEDWVDEFLTRPLSKEDKLEASKALWYGSEEKIYDDGDGFRVYLPKNQKQCVAFGIYENHLAQKIGGFNWCITTTNERSTYYNMYRDKGLTYYFVINDKLATSDQNHISAIMPISSDGSGANFEYTDLKNSGGNRTGVRLEHTNLNLCLTCLHPQLQGNDEAIEILSRSIPYDTRRELNIGDGSVDPIARINEREGDRWDFARRNRREKIAYITNGNYLRSVRSFESMTSELLVLYIKTTNNENWTDRFQTYEIFKLFLDNNDLSEKLRRRIAGDDGDQPIEVDGRSVTFGDIQWQFIKNKYATKYAAINHDSTKIVMGNSTGEPSFGKYGIWDGDNGDWLTHNGITYDPTFDAFENSEWPATGFFPKDEPEQVDEPKQDEEPQQEPSNDIETDNDEMGNTEDLNEQMTEETMFFVSCYSRSNSGDANDNFYTIHSVSNVSSTPYVTIMSHSVWESKVKPNFRMAWEGIDTEEYYSDLTQKFKGKIS
jgi:hypothetical protein